jgi:hypothetical protein
MANSAMYLNNALSLLGISSPIEDMLKMADKALPLTPVTISQVFNCMYTLLRLRQVCSRDASPSSFLLLSKHGPLW